MKYGVCDGGLGNWEWGERGRGGGSFVSKVLMVLNGFMVFHERALRAEVVQRDGRSGAKVSVNI